MANSNLTKVHEWQSLFGKGGRHIVSKNPKWIDLDLAEIRITFLSEEMDEYLRANENQDLVEILDALCDLQYFLFGMVVIHGLQDVFDEAFGIVHDSNMSKLGKDGKPILREDGKILKGKNYWQPTEKLKELLNGNTPIKSRA